MAITSGFFNSLNGDRRYDAEQMSSLFDGIIRDGVFQNIGNRFVVSSTGGLNITVGTGRAWFNHTWTNNDGLLPLTLSSAPLLLNRIDAVVLEINSEQGTRRNSIKIIEGTTATNPARPTMIRTDTVNHYALAYITRREGTTSIGTADITTAVGTTETPYVTAPLQVVSVDSYLATWNAQFNNWFNDLKETFDEADVATITAEIARLEGTVETANNSMNAARQDMNTLSSTLGTRVTTLETGRVKSNQNRQIFVGSTTPTGAVNGDIWFKV